MVEKSKVPRSVKLDPDLLAMADEVYELRGYTFSSRVEALVKKDLADNPLSAQEKDIMKGLKAIRKKNK